jgi:Cytochrome c oxidase caa3 assembly factor (Caa3_CtaG)
VTRQPSGYRTWPWTAQAAHAESERASRALVLRRVRPWLAAVGVVLSLAVVLPPVASYARQYAFVQAAQFVVFAVLTPAFLALGMPARFTGLRRGSGQRRRAPLVPSQAAASRLVPFIALVIVWRLPAVLDALTRYPALSVAELVTLAGAGLGVWRFLAGSAAPGQLPRPQRAAMAALAMWTIWIIAYITGMSSLALIPRSAPAERVLASAVDRQLATAVLWAVPAICFAPVVYYMLISWLGERDRQERDQRLPADVRTAGYNPADRALRGWRHRGGHTQVSKADEP